MKFDKPAGQNPVDRLWLSVILMTALMVNVKSLVLLRTHGNGMMKPQKLRMATL